MDQRPMGSNDPEQDRPTKSEAKTVVTIGPGHRLGKYTIESIIGRGGMGAVYLATDRELDRQVALKVISMPLSDSESTEAIGRFQREARTAASLTHPGIVRVYEGGAFNGKRVGSPFMTLPNNSHRAIGLRKNGRLKGAPSTDIRSVFDRC